MAITEAALKTILTETARKAFGTHNVFRHEDRFRAGVPDISITQYQRVAWLEVKVANPRLVLRGKSRGVQWCTMMSLALQSYARYLIYQTTSRETYLVHPRDVVTEEWQNLAVRWDGFNHQEVVRHVARQLQQKGT